ncbi:MAG: VCBS repeat-containing protein [Candidatus Hydrogenedentes bacterium]|nr:VCBS repeat-containing protein [Candidatus Hydrogenedentota bacterium]
MALGDLNGDGAVDVVTASSFSSPTGTISVMLGKGDGGFGAKTEYGTGARPEFVALGDVDGNGTLDVVTANFDSDTISVLLGAGDGTFGAKTDFAAGDGSKSVALGDLDGNGTLDAVVANSNAGTVSVLSGLGDGNFGSPTAYATGSRGGLNSVALGDLDGNGTLDVAVAAGTLILFSGLGDGTLGAPTAYGGTSGSSFVTLEDLDGNGTLDAALVGYRSTMTIFLGLGNGQFGTSTQYTTGPDPRWLSFGDVDGNGTLDAVTANFQYGADSISILPGLGDGSFGTRTDHATDIAPTSAHLVDLDGDGKMDIVVSNAINYAFGSISIMMGEGDGSFPTRTDYATSTFPHFVTLGDLDGDGALDAVVVNFLSDGISVFPGLGDGSFGTRTDYATGSAPRSAALGDLNADGALDVVVANLESDNVSVMLGLGDGSFGAKIDYVTGTLPISVALGDFNRDGTLDLAVANNRSNDLSILPGTGDGSFGTRTDYPAGHRPYSLILGDLNNNGILDAVVTNLSGSWGAISVLIGNGDGSFNARKEYLSGTAPRSVALGDLDGNGSLDAIVAMATNRMLVLSNQGDGRLWTVGAYGVGRNPVSTTLGDLDGNGTLDAVVTNGHSDDISVLLGVGDGTFRDIAFYMTGGFPISVALGDLDGNGSLDVVTANLDSNSMSVLLSQLDFSSPVLLVSPLTFSATIEEGDFLLDQGFTVKNSGGGTLDYSISDDVDWLSVIPTSGTSTGETDTITLSYDAQTLPPRVYSGHITISAAGAIYSPQVIDVTLTVVPVLSLAADSESSSGGGCFIATAAYGTPLSTEIDVLRTFRDKYLLTNWLGTFFVDTYYSASPRLADLVARHDLLRAITRGVLVPVTGFAALALYNPFIAFFVLLPLFGIGFLRARRYRFTHG